MREVITIQTGSFANYVGAHYWNIQVIMEGYRDASAAFKNHSLHEHPACAAAVWRPLHCRTKPLAMQRPMKAGNMAHISIPMCCSAYRNTRY